MVEADVVEAVIALGKNLFYNSSMESCILVCRTNKAKARRNRVLFINAFDDIRHEKTVSFLEEEHIQKVVEAYNSFEDREGFAAVVAKEEVLKGDASLLVTKYLKSSRVGNHADHDLDDALADWSASEGDCNTAMRQLFAELS
jgi:type I restriction enzyme M protein